jgi:predicted ATP-grasp superfamily ATP-dependent carboligase
MKISNKIKEKVGVLITGGDFQALAAIRTLGKKGIPVIVLEDEYSISRFSKYTKSIISSPPIEDKEKYVEYLYKLGKMKKFQGWMILPNSDEAVALLSRNRDSLSEYFRIPTPSWDVVKYVYIKENTYKFAESCGIPVPKTYYVESINELIENNVKFPLVMKPSIRDNFYNITKIKALKINSQEELVKKYKWMSQVIDSSEILIQEFIPGGPKNLYSFCPFFKDGKIITGIMARRARQHPMDFGHASTYAETVNIPEMRNLAERFLKTIGYYGIGEVEFMYDPREHVYKLIELNPRIWGWHSLAIAAGADLPYLLYQDMLNKDLHVTEIKNNLKWIRLTTDLPTVFSELIKGNLRLSEYIKTMHGPKEYAVFSLSDPLPFFAEIAMIPYLFLKRGF